MRKGPNYYFLTNRCNLNCTYCLTNAFMDRSSSKDIDYDFAINGISDYALDRDQLYIRFYAIGEPTCAFELMQRIADYARKEWSRHIIFELQTNGYFENYIAQWIAENIDICWISFDGLPELNRRNRINLPGADVSDMVLTNVAYLNKHTSLGLRITITPESVHYQTEMIRFAGQLGVKAVASKPQLPKVRYQHNEAFNAVNLMDYATAFVKAWKVANELGIMYSNILIANFDKSVKYACRACLPAPHLTVDGHVSCCDRAFYENTILKELVYGRYETSSKRIVYDQKKIARLRSRIVHNMLDCRNCELNEYCAGGCLGTAYQLTRSIFKTVPEYCAATKYFAAHIQPGTITFRYHHP